MGFLALRARAISAYLVERLKYGVPEICGNPRGEVVFILDGVGGFQFAPLLVRRALRQIHHPLCTIVFDWQYGLTGEIWTDLMWLRRNRVMGARFARRLLSFRRTHPDVRIHVLAFSGGAAIAVFGCESLRGRPIIDTLILACPALSPQYNLASALRTVTRAYACVSAADRWILGLGTSLFGTSDRRFGPAGGMVGFQLPSKLSAEEKVHYSRLRQICWSKEWRSAGHSGGHTSWASVRFLREHLLPLLRGEPLLPTGSLQ